MKCQICGEEENGLIGCWGHDLNKVSEGYLLPKNFPVESMNFYAVYESEKNDYIKIDRVYAEGIEGVNYPEGFTIRNLVYENMVQHQTGLLNSRWLFSNRYLGTFGNMEYVWTIMTKKQADDKLKIKYG